MTQRVTNNSAAPFPSLPIARDALGLGLRVPHYSYIEQHQPNIDFFEIISENFLSDAAPPRWHLAEIRRRYPIVLHGVGLNLLSHQPLDESYLDRLASLAEWLDAPYVTDHLCWTGAHGVVHHDLLPTPYVPELVSYAAERAAYVQQRLGRPFGIENLSSYVQFHTSTLTEWEFYTQVVKASGCWYMLDINNIYVSSENHLFNPRDYLRAIDFSRVLQVHLAGHERQENNTIIDTHDRAVSDAVWQLYAEAWQRGGPFPTLLEWDENIPPLPVMQQELNKARELRL